jgi:hypothetical protein
MGTTEAAVELTRGIGTPRLIDLALRLEAKNLTSAEELALAILAGNADAIMAAVDAAQEEYANGTYRVPVKVVADWNKTLMVYTPGQWAVNANIHRVRDDMMEFRNDLAASGVGAGVIVLKAGDKFEVYESAAPGVEVKAVKEAA